MLASNLNQGRFMVAVGAVIQHVPTNTLLLIQRSKQLDFRPGHWEIIYGRLQQFEDPETGLAREVQEETQLSISIVKPLRVFHFFRGDRSAETEIVGVTYWVTTDTQEITISDEHEGYKWVSPDEALQIVDEPGIALDIQAFKAEAGV